MQPASQKLLRINILRIMVKNQLLVIRPSMGRQSFVNIQIRVDPDLNISNFDVFSNILAKVFNFMKPAPQKLLRINILRIMVKKLAFGHTSFNVQTVICMEKPKVDP